MRCRQAGKRGQRLAAARDGVTPFLISITNNKETVFVLAFGPGSFLQVYNSNMTWT